MAGLIAAAVNAADLVDANVCDVNVVNNLLRNANIEVVTVDVDGLGITVIDASGNTFTFPVSLS